MTPTLRTEEVRDRVEVALSVALVATSDGGLVTSDQIAQTGSALLQEAFKQLSPTPTSTDPGLDPWSVVGKAVELALAALESVNQPSGRGKGEISLTEIRHFAEQPSPMAKELGGYLREFHGALADWSKLPLSGLGIATECGKLAENLSCMVAGNNESDFPVLPFHMAVPGKHLRARSRSDVVDALGLDPKRLSSNLVTDYSSAAFFFCELAGYRDEKRPELGPQAKELLSRMMATLRETRLCLLGSNEAPEDWDWKPILDAIVAVDKPLLQAVVGQDMTVQKLAKIFGAELGAGDPLEWSPTQVPVLIIGTAPDGSLAGLLGCLTWT